MRASPDETLTPVFLEDPINRSNPLNSGLLFWYLALPELSGGAKFYDIVRNFHGDLSSPTPDWQPTTRMGGAGQLRFYNTNKPVVTPTLPSMTDTSFGCWVQCNSVPAGYHAILFSTTGASLYHQGSNFVYYLGTQANSTTTIVAGVWYHVFCVYAAADNTRRLYINGIQEATVSASGVPTGILRIGADTGTQHLDGAVDDVRYYNRAISAAEVKSLYDLSRAGYPGILNRWQQTARNSLASILAAAAALIGVSSLQATGSAQIAGSAALVGVSSLAAAGAALVNGGAAMTGVALLTPAGVVITQATAALVGVSSLQAAGAAQAPGAAAMIGVSALTASGKVVQLGQAALTGVGALSGSGIDIVQGGAALVGCSLVTANGSNGTILPLIIITAGAASDGYILSGGIG